MNDLDEILRAAREDPSPSASITQKHRLALRAAIESAHPPPVRRTVLRRRGTWTLSFGAVLAVAAISAAVVVITSPGDDAAQRISVSAEQGDEPSTTPSPGAAMSSECGSALPVRVAPPPEFEGPSPGPATGSSAGSSGQLVQHWTAPGRSIEVRWPPDESLLLAPKPEPQPGIATVVSMPTPDAAGRYLRIILFDALPSDQVRCQAVQVTVLDEDAERADSLVELLLGEAADLDRRLVVASVDADDAPGVVTCRAPLGVQPPPNRGDRIDADRFDSPRDALRDFVRRDASLPQAGFWEFVLSDGSIAYGAPIATEDGFVLVVRVINDSERWEVHSWEASGC